MKYKKYLEKNLGNSISNATYYRIKMIMKNQNLDFSKSNLELVANLKIELKKHRIPLEIGLSYYLKIADRYEKISGIDLYSYLKKLTNAHRTTIIRWIDDFNPDKIYQSELSKIMLSAFIYLIRRQKNATNKKSNRSYQISVKEK